MFCFYFFIFNSKISLNRKFNIFVILSEEIRKFNDFGYAENILIFFSIFVDQCLWVMFRDTDHFLEQVTLGVIVLL